MRALAKNDLKAAMTAASPPSLSTKLSLRAHNFNSETLKVNDKRGNPVEIAAVVVWRVEDTAQAAFDVEDYESYVQVQSESAIREHREPLRLRPRRGARADAARQRRRGRARADEGVAGAAGEGRRRGRRSAAHAPRLRAGDRLGDAAPPAGRGHRRGAAADRAGRRGHGATWRCRNSSRRMSCSWIRSARPRWSATCSWCCAATMTHRRSSTPARSTTDRAAGTAQGLSAAGPRGPVEGAREMGRGRPAQRQCAGRIPPAPGPGAAQGIFIQAMTSLNDFQITAQMATATS